MEAKESCSPWEEVEPDTLGTKTSDRVGEGWAWARGSGVCRGRAENWGLVGTSPRQVSPANVPEPLQTPASPPCAAVDSESSGTALLYLCGLGRHQGPSPEARFPRKERGQTGAGA